MPSISCQQASWEGGMNPTLRTVAAVLAICLFQQPATAAEIKILSIPGVKAALDQLKPVFERESGHRLAIRYEIYPRQKDELKPAISTSRFLPSRRSRSWP